MTLVVYAAVLIVLGSVVGRLASQLSRRRLWAYVAAVIPAAAFGYLASAFAIGFARELETTTGEFVLSVSVISLIALPFSLLGAFLVIPKTGLARPSR